VASSKPQSYQSKGHVQFEWSLAPVDLERALCIPQIRQKRLQDIEAKEQSPAKRRIERQIDLDFS
jgi:hypothetical protein